MSERLLPGADNPPSDRHCINDYPAILAQAQQALARRKEAYPQLVAKGQMPSEEATRDVASWEMLVAEWTWIITGEGAPPPSFTLFDRIDAVELALERVGTSLRRRSRDATLLEQRDLITAMRWHLTHLRYGVPGCHFWAELTHQCRKAASATAPAERAAA